jgi:hypothetical protein
MKRLSTILATGTLALALVTPALAGSTGIQRSYDVTQPDPVTLAELDQALDVAGQNERDLLQQQQADMLQQQQKALAAEMAAMRNPFSRLDYRR